MDSRFKSLTHLRCDSKFRLGKYLTKLDNMAAKAGVSTSQTKPKIQFTGKDLNQLLASNSRLISVSREITNKVFDYFTDKSNILILCDMRGYILDIVSSTEIIQIQL